MLTQQKMLTYFRGASQPQKLNARKFLYNEKLQRQIFYEAYYTWLAHLRV